MKKNIFIAAALLLLAGFVACSRNDEPTTDTGVVLNNVRWATRNVDTPGTFTATPECLGMLYQWNRRTAWATTGEVTNWDGTFSTSSVWEERNDPCPPGWRMPTQIELRNLERSVPSEWATRYGVTGRIFGTPPHQIFLPAAGFRMSIPIDGRPDGVNFFKGVAGYYWAATATNQRNSIMFHQDEAEVREATSNRQDALSIRCVAR